MQRDYKARTKRSHRRKQKAMLDGWASSLVDDWEVSTPGTPLHISRLLLCWRVQCEESPDRMIASSMQATANGTT